MGRKLGRQTRHRGWDPGPVAAPVTAPLAAAALTAAGHRALGIARLSVAATTHATQIATTLWRCLRSKSEAESCGFSRSAFRLSTSLGSASRTSGFCPGVAYFHGLISDCQEDQVRQAPAPPSDEEKAPRR